MEWTLAAFEGAGGTTNFVDRLAASLGIHASTIKVVDVYTGSLVVKYDITPNEDEPLDLAQIKKKQTKKFAEGKVSFAEGVTVLDVTSGSEKVISGGVVTAIGFERKVLVRTWDNVGDIIWLDWF